MDDPHEEPRTEQSVLEDEAAPRSFGGAHAERDHHDGGGHHGRPGGRGSGHGEGEHGGMHAGHEEMFRRRFFVSL